MAQCVLFEQNHRRRFLTFRSYTPTQKARPPLKSTAMLALSLVGLGSVAERTVEDQAVGSAHRQLGKKNKGPCIPNWQECNNANTGSTTCCADGLMAYSCQAITDSYSQCKPAQPPPPPSPPSPPPASSPPPTQTTPTPTSARCSADTMSMARDLVNERKQTLTVASSKFGSLLDSKDFAKEWESFVDKLP